MISSSRTFRRRIGEILVNDGIVSQEQIDEALAIQKTSRDPLGAILMDMGIVTESDIARCMCVQYQLPFISMVNYELDEKLSQLVRKEILHQHKLLPFDKVGSMLLIAVSEIPPEDALAEIAKSTQMSVALYIGYLSEISRELERLCSAETKQSKSKGNPTKKVAAADDDDSEADEGDENVLVFGSSDKSSFLAELDSTWDTIFEESKGQAPEKQS